MQSKRYIIYCDESEDKGRYFSNFYGGALITANDRQEIERILNEKKTELNLHQEIKWTKVTENYLEKYLKFVDCYFDLVKDGRIKVRLMFTQNIYEAEGLEEHQIDNQFFLLYYQLIKNAFGLRYCNPERGNPVHIALLLDDVPDNKEKFANFKRYICSLCDYPVFTRELIKISYDDISEVKSGDHVILQGLDIILGAVQFRLNDKHKEKPKGERRRGKRTVAKEKVYKFINKRIREIHPGFNIGINTGMVTREDRWRHTYRHWLLVPGDYKINLARAKKR